VSPVDGTVRCGRVPDPARLPWPPAANRVPSRTGALYRRGMADNDEQAQQRSTRMVLLKAIEEYANGVGPEQLLELAQAYAWIVSPEKTGDSSHPLA